MLLIWAYLTYLFLEHFYCIFIYFAYKLLKNYTSHWWINRQVSCIYKNCPFCSMHERIYTAKNFTNLQKRVRRLMAFIVTEDVWQFALTFDGGIRMMVTVGHVTSSPLLKARAVLASVLRLDFDSSGPGHGAGTAVGVAGRPGSPWVHLAIDNCNEEKRKFE